MTKPLKKEQIEELDWSFLEEKVETKDTEKGLPGRKECMIAMCSRCMGYYIDGHDDCQDPACPLYSYYKYATQEPNLTWRTEGFHLKRNRRKLRFELDSTTRRHKKSKK